MCYFPEIFAISAKFKCYSLDMTTTIQPKPIKAFIAIAFLSIALILSLVVNVIQYSIGSQFANEKSDLKEIYTADIGYINKISDYDKELWVSWKMMSDINVGLLKNTISDADLAKQVKDYEIQSAKTKKALDEVTIEKQKRIEILNSLKFFKITQLNNSSR